MTLPLGRWGVTQWAWGDADAPAWGAADESDNNLFWAIEVDWDNDHVFDGTNEAVYTVHYEGGLGRKDYLRIEGESDDREAVGFYELEPGTAQLVVDNNSGRYSPRNTGSVLYPNVKRGRDVRVRVKYGIEGAWRNRFAGVIDDMQFSNDENGDKFATFYLVAHEKKLQRDDATVGLQKNVKISAAIGLVLDAIAWPSYLGRNIESTSSTLNYFWTQGRRALSELRGLANGDLGVVFCDGAGVLTYYQRNHAGSVVVAIDESDCLKNIKQSDAVEVICNKIEVTALLRNLQTSGTIAQLSGDTPLVPAGETREYFLPINYNGQDCPADNIIAPVATTDYTMNSAANGSGTNLTANFTVTHFDLGNTVLARVKNNGATDGYITLLKVRGNAITQSSLVLKTEDATSQAEYGVLRMKYASDWLQSANEGESIRDYLLLLLKDAPGFFEIEMQDRFDKQFEAGLMDVVEATFDYYAVAAENFRVGYYYDQWVSSNGQSVKTSLRLEPVISVSGDYFVYGTSHWEVDTYYAP